MIKRTQFKIGTIKNLQSYISRKDSQRGFSKEKVGQKLLKLAAPNLVLELANIAAKGISAKS